LNFLAHFYLSEHQPKIIVGNFLGDFLTSKLRETLEKDIQKGIFLHYDIDEFTDKHALVKAGNERLATHFGKYSSVVSDIYFDYFLAKDWQKYEKMPLAEFAQKVYGILENHQELFNLKARLTFEHMRKHNWLLHYAQYEGISRTLHGLSRRASHLNSLEKAGIYLQNDADYWQKLFDEFFPELRLFCQKRKGA
jgi:acyl carrier protein phosphodiesterase